ncbi:glycine oxidase ThiO [Promicromonospora soli]|uniref:glycine oxidase n=1 Tax=Promicromonospora soli TaxID=2035533 RepID=A0A919KZG0_9MICO|nr:glycine oxidase ThiO [Promicromonospora soli]GHH79180.1 glycine/D-amino acid oxidase [Promicromonospora soli]
MSSHVCDVLVIGGGIIGLTAAWRALEAGASVVVLDPSPGDGATHAAAGMLAPVMEAGFGEEGQARLGTASLALWPAFADALERAAGLPPGAVGLETTGTIALAYDGDDLVALRRMLALHHEWDLGSVEISPDEARRREPGVGLRVAGAAWVPGDHRVDPRAVRAALAAIAARRTLVPRAAISLTWADGAVVGAIDDAGTAYAAGTVVLAAGHASASLFAGAPTRPVPGTTLRLDADADRAPAVVVRGTVQGRPVYAVPRRVRPDGRREVVVGATSDEREDDHLTRAGDVFALLRDARALLPGLDDAVLLGATTRSRPGSPDNAPLLGWAADGLYLATGHHRNGILLTPLTAAAVDRALGVARSAEPRPSGVAPASVEAAVEAATRFANPRRFADPVLSAAGIPHGAIRGGTS